MNIKRERGAKLDKNKKYTKKSNSKKFEKSFDKPQIEEERTPISKEDKEKLRQKHYSKKKLLEYSNRNLFKDGAIRLNRFLANAGVCSRRDADKLISNGEIKINGQVVSEIGIKVTVNDTVEHNGKRLFAEEKVYILLNKPKDYVTTMDDKHAKRKVTDLLHDACNERVYPVGRLDRMTTGVLLFTNDGDLAKKLTHPKYNKKKIYHVILDKPINTVDFEKILKGVKLEDGFIKPDALEFIDPTDKRHVGIEIHSGKNRVVRRIFKHLNYTVDKLDRVYFAGLTKKNVPRGKWRYLSPAEVKILKTY